MTAPVGAVVRFWMQVEDPAAPAPANDDWVVSVASGRCWVVIGVCPVTRGPNAGRRWKLTCAVQRGPPPAGSPRWRMRWQSSRRRRR